MFDFLMNLPVESTLIIIVLNILSLIGFFSYYWHYKTVSTDADGCIKSLGQLRSELKLQEEYKKALESYLSNTKEELAKLENERAVQEKLRHELAILQTELAKKEEEYKVLSQQLLASEEAIKSSQEQKNKIQDLTEELKRYETITEEARVRFKAEEDRLNELIKNSAVQEEQIRNNNNELAKFQALMIEVVAQQANKVALQAEISGLQEELYKIKSEKNDIEATRDQFDKLRNSIADNELKLNMLIQEIGSKTAIKEKIDKEINSLNSDSNSYTQSIEDGSFNGLFSRPKCLSMDYFSRMKNEESESEAIDAVIKKLKRKGLIFSNRLINSFHTCLKISDISSLTVLAGVSGTGKTLLPLEYSKAIGMYSLVVPVQPRWDSPQDMLGFYNFVEKKYEATELVRALVSMDPYNFGNASKAKDSILLVLLDEMNLARVEYYFSEFLSKLELRRTVGNFNDPEKRSIAEIVIGSNNNSKKLEEHRLWVSSNVLFVGTMNEDESTQSLSDKVLDRANVIKFGSPKPKENKTIINQEDGQLEQLSSKMWEKWKKKELENNSNAYEVRENLDNINKALEKVGRPIGYRVQDSIVSYVLNYPGNRWQNALTDQIEYKLLPKLRGLNTEDDDFRNLVEGISDLAQKYNDTELENAISNSLELSSRSGSGTFVWNGVNRSE